MGPLQLPEEVLRWICQTALEAGVPASTLSTINSHWHTACYGILYEHLAIPDDYQSLLQPSGPRNSTGSSRVSAVQTSRAVRKLESVTRNSNYAKIVKAFYILESDVPDLASVRNDTSSTATQGVAGSAAIANEAATTEATFKQSNEDHLLHLVKTHLTSIQSFTWGLRAPPSRYFMTQLHEACAHLSSIDLLHAPRDTKNWDAPTCLDPSSPVRSHAPTLTLAQTRWDALCLAGFQLSRLVSLTVQNLSSEGVKLFGSLCTGLVSCKTLEIWDTLFVDDSLLTSISLNLHNLCTLRIKRMPGTKVTNKGIAAIMENSLALEVLVLEEFEGRLTKKCWEDIISYPVMFRCIKIVYAENCPHAHSWTTDHLTSIASLIERTEGLEIFHVGRLASSSDRLAAGDHMDQTPVPAAMQPRPLPEGFLAVLMKHSHTLRSVNLDFWELSYDRLRTIFEVFPGLQKLQILLDAPFPKLLGASSFHMARCQLEVLSVSITDRFQTKPPIASDAKSRTRSKSVVEGTVGEPSTHRARQLSVGGLKLDKVSQEEAPTVPPLKDVKKLVKRFSHLSILEWSGRHGAGAWQITRAAHGKGVTVHSPVIQNLDEMSPALPDLPEIHVPGLRHTLAQLGLNLRKTDAYQPATPDNGLVKSVTSSSLATSLSVSTESSSSNRSNSNTTVPSSPGSPKERLSPVRRLDAIPAKAVVTTYADTAASPTRRDPTGSGSAMVTGSKISKAGDKQDLARVQQPSPTAAKKVHRDGWVTRKPASKGTVAAPPVSNKPPQSKRHQSPPPPTAKPAALTEENLKHFKKTALPSKSNAVAGSSTIQPNRAVAQADKSKQSSDVVDGGFALLGRTKRTGKKA